jgi:hypothetical protein
MKRPAGITVSAVFSLLGSLAMLGLCLLIGAMLLLQRSTSAETKPGLAISLVMFGVLGTWGLISAIGLLGLRNWARISIVVFSVLLAAVGLCSTPVILLMPMPSTPPNFGTVRIGIAIAYGALGVLGAVWLYYFNRRATREAFSGGMPAVESARPLSIAIIGWWLLVSGTVTMILAVALRLPAATFVWLITGWHAVVWYLAWGALWAYVGYGLLRLKAVARTVAIWALCFGAVQGIVFFAFPGKDARMASFASRMPFGAHPAAPATFPPTGVMVPLMVFGVAVPLWFLIRRKAAFGRNASAGLS